MIRILRTVALPALLVLAATQVAANGVLSLPLAIGIATVISGVSPVLLGLLRQRYPSLDGNTMAGISFAIAAVITLGAALASGELKFADFNDAAKLAGAVGWLWTVQQAVYKILNARPTLTKLVSPPA